MTVLGDYGKVLEVTQFHGDNRDLSPPDCEIIERRLRAGQSFASPWRGKDMPMNTMMQRLTSLLCALFVVAIAASPALAQSAPDAYPSRPIRILIPFSPGGTTDIIARALSAELRKSLGQSI